MRPVIMLARPLALSFVLALAGVSGCSGSGVVSSGAPAQAGAGGAAGEGATGEGAGGAGAMGGDGGSIGLGGSSGLGGSNGVGGIDATCSGPGCFDTCEAAAKLQSNVGCEFYAADLDMTDLLDVGGQPWGLVIANAGTKPAEVVIERNDAPYGQPAQIAVVNTGTLMPGQLGVVKPGTAILDCGTGPDQHDAPGTCLSSRAHRVRSTAPVVVYQINNFNHQFSTDASLLLPVTSVGQKYRVLGWPSAHPEKDTGIWVARTYVTVIGTQPDTQVKVTAGWRIKGNPPVPAADVGGTITATLGPFDVLNLECDDSTLQEVIAASMSGKTPFPTDLTGTTVEASAPVVVFSGAETAGVGLPQGAPVPDHCQPDPLDPQKNNDCGCCLQHFEEQLAPLESLGKKYVVTRSPIRSDPAYYVEPDVLRFVGAAETTTVKTTMPPPFDTFTLAPGEIKDTWTTTDVIVEATAPVLIGQFLVAGSYITPTYVGDPSFTIVPPFEQANTEYLFLSPEGWDAWVVIGAPVGVDVTVDGGTTEGCTVTPIGTLDGVMYESRRCQLPTGTHRLSSKSPFGIMAYGFSNADAYAFPGGAFFKRIYEPPPLN